MGTVLSLISLTLAFIGVMAETRIKGKKFPGNITVFGFIVIGLITLNTAITLTVQADNNDKRDLALVGAYLEIESTLYNSVMPYIEYTDPVFVTLEDYPRGEILKSYHDSGLFEILCDVDYRGEYGDTQRFIGNVFSKSAQRNKDAFGSIISKYDKYLSEKIVFLLSKILTHPWVDFQVTLENRVNQYLRRSGPGGEFVKERNQTNVTCGKERFREKYLVYAQDYSALLMDLEKEIFSEFNRLNEKGIIIDHEPLLLERSWWFEPT